MVRKLLGIAGVFVFIVTLSGCATMRKNNDLEVQGLKNQVSLLETQISSKDEEINSLRESLNKTSQQAQTIVDESNKKASFDIKDRPTNKQIQTALANAGFDPGSSDGHMGRKTREAIRAFQKANNLHADGKVGKKTWELLKEFLEKKVK
ncbi:MAG TPA: peptidoglycan-binding domain-containing protein [Candidatus Omnitrophota bacterium]|nr:peptidoglycan-binding domain-containing protein [Candidatus Omnitrophota bacterium]HPT07502.1 peptidoglycan-binding domain-containing protein [Candidatus Omnitrophota bacterium]